MKTNNKGFSLVELIVVIAIMAVLAAVAVIGVSIYVPKAQQAADKQLVSDIEQILNLYYQGEANATAGYVILKLDGDAEASDNLNRVMEDAFGANWKQELALAHDGWTSDALMDVVAKYELEDAQLIVNSTFMKNPDGMLEATTNLLGIATDRIFEKFDQDPTTATTYLNALDPSLVTTLEKLGLTPGTEAYSQAVSNLLVGHFANAMKPSTEKTPNEDGEDPTKNVSDLATFYAQVYAYSEMYEKKNDTDETTMMIEKLDELIAADGYSSISSSGNTGKYKLALRNYDQARFNDMAKYFTENGENDKDAFIQMMEAVSVVANGYKNDADALKDGGLYASPAVKDQVDQFANALNAKISGNFPAAGAVGEKDVLILLYSDGSIISSIGE